MKRICRMEDIHGLKDWPNGFVEALEERFYELKELYQGGDNFTLEPYGEIVLAERYEEIQDLMFDEVNPLMMGGEKIDQCLYLPNNDERIEIYILEKQMSLEERNQLIEQNN